MPVTNFPGGVASYGIPVTGGDSDIPPGAVWWVCNRAGVVNGDGTSRDKPLVSLADAVVRVQATNPVYGERIYILPGHAENVTAANTFSGSTVNTAVTFIAGTRIIGLGRGAYRPTFTFTATASKITPAAGCSFENLIFTVDPAVNTVVTLGFNVLAADVSFAGSKFVPAVTGPFGLFTTMMNVGTSGDDSPNFAFDGNEVLSPTLSTNPTNILKINTAVSNLKIRRNKMLTATSSLTVGAINVAAAATNVEITDNKVANLNVSSTGSTVAINLTAATTGVVTDNDCIVRAATGGAAAITNLDSLVGNGARNYGTAVGGTGKTGILIGTNSS